MKCSRKYYSSSNYSMCGGLSESLIEGNVYWMFIAAIGIGLIILGTLTMVETSSFKGSSCWT